MVSQAWWVLLLQKLNCEKLSFVVVVVAVSVFQCPRLFQAAILYERCSLNKTILL